MQQSDLSLNLSTKKTRKREFLEQMQQVVPWKDLVALIAPYALEGRRGRPPFPVEMLLRIHFVQQWFTLSDQAMEEALHDMPLFRDFAAYRGTVPHQMRAPCLRFRHLLETHKLAEQILQTVTDLLVSKKLLLRTGTIVDVTLIAAPSSTKNSTKSRDPEMHQTKKGNQWYFGMKAHIGVDADSGLAHTVRDTSANVGDVVEAIYRIMARHQLLLPKAPLRRQSSRVHDGRVSVATSDLRWCSDGFEIQCDSGQTVTATFAKDCCDREILAWRAWGGKGLPGEPVRDMLIEAVERRFGAVDAVPLERELEFLTDNGSAYIAHETRSIARSLGLKPINTPVCSPQSNGMAESFVNTFKRDYVSRMDLRDELTVLAQLPGAF